MKPKNLNLKDRYIFEEIMSLCRLSLGYSYCPFLPIRATNIGSELAHDLSFYLPIDNVVS